MGLAPVIGRFQTSHGGQGENGSGQAGGWRPHGPQLAVPVFMQAGLWGGGRGAGELTSGSRVSVAGGGQHGGEAGYVGEGVGVLVRSSGPTHWHAHPAHQAPAA